MNHWEMTDIGLVRKENQDAYAVQESVAGVYTVGVVCDGMGGTAGGRIASDIAVRTYTQTLAEQLKAGMTPEELEQASSAAVSAANRAICEAAATMENCDSMGTTLVSAILYPGGAVVTNVGDSRAYQAGPEGIRRITKDHSLVENMIDRGDITAEEARHHPGRNLITRALGPDANAACDCYCCTMEQGTFILLCSDGLVNTVTDQEMLFEILHGGELSGCLSRLLDISKQHGAPDNVTAVLLTNQG